MILREHELKLIRNDMHDFPETFGLKAFPGRVFRINPQTSYVNDRGQVLLYTDVQSRGQWICFAKGTRGELWNQLIRLPK